MTLVSPENLESEFTSSSEGAVPSVADKVVLAVHKETGERFSVSARYVDERRTQDRENGVPVAERWHRQHRFFCSCCGQTAEYSHVKSAEHRHNKHKKSKITSTHWRLKDGHRHERGCPEYKKDLQALLGGDLVGKDYILKPSFILPPSRTHHSIFNGTSLDDTDTFFRSAEGASRTNSSGINSKRSMSSENITITDLRELEDAVDLLRTELPEDEFERVRLQIPKIGKVSASESFFSCDEGQVLVESLCEEGARGPFFLEVVPDLQCVSRNAGNVQFLCHGMPVEFSGYEFVLRPVVSVVGDDFADNVLSGHVSQGEALRIMIDPDSCSDLATKIRRNIRQNNPEGVIEFEVSAKTFNNVPNIGRAKNIDTLDRNFYLRPEWFL